MHAWTHRQLDSPPKLQSCTLAREEGTGCPNLASRGRGRSCSRRRVDLLGQRGISHQPAPSLGEAPCLPQRGETPPTHPAAPAPTVRKTLMQIPTATPLPWWLSGQEASPAALCPPGPHPPCDEVL